jgi:hypothetical protein
MSTTTDTTHARKSSTRLTVPSGGADPLSPSGRGVAATAKGGSGTPTVTARLVWNNNNPTATTTNASSSHHQFYFLYWQRLMDVRQMDVQAALDQMRTLLSLRPQSIYKTAYYRKQTKNHWSRDDPAFLVLQLIFLTIASFSYGIAFRAPISNGLSFWVASVVWNWLGLGMVVATTTQYIADKYLQSHGGGRTTHVQQNVEWLYAFDIHCNSFFPVFCVLCTYYFLAADCGRIGFLVGSVCGVQTGPLKRN